MDEDAIYEYFTDAVNIVHDLYKKEHVYDCISALRELLEEPSMPNYHRMRSLLLLASTLGNWSEANECRTAAEAVWRIERREYPEGEDEAVDEYMAEISEELANITHLLEEKTPQNDKADINDVDKVFSDAQEMMEGLDLGADAMGIEGNEFELHEAKDEIIELGAIPNSDEGPPKVSCSDFLSYQYAQLKHSSQFINDLLARSALKFCQTVSI